MPLSSMFLKLFRRFKPPITPSGNLYYARLNCSGKTYYKIGFTTKSTLIERMAFENLGHEKEIEKELLFCFRSDAYAIEQRLLNHFRKKRAFKKFSNDPNMPLSGRGQSELFRVDVLGLDDDLYLSQSPESSAAERSVLDEQNIGALVMLGGLLAMPFTFGVSLFAIWFGWLVFSSVGSKAGARPAASRPTHPPAVRQLLDDLKKDCGLSKRLKAAI